MIGKISLFAFAMAMTASAHAGEFKATSTDFADGKVKNAQFSDTFGCTGGNISPEISWSGAPKGTKSFVVTLYDKDAPTGSGWWHWVVVNIPADVVALESGAGSGKGKLPAGAIMMKNDAGMASFGGACPPPGPAHQYTITVKALKVDKLQLPADASAAMVGFMSNMNALATAQVSAMGAQ